MLSEQGSESSLGWLGPGSCTTVRFPKRKALPGIELGARRSGGPLPSAVSSASRPWGRALGCGEGERQWLIQGESGVLGWASPSDTFQKRDTERLSWPRTALAFSTCGNSIIYRDLKLRVVCCHFFGVFFPRRSSVWAPITLEVCSAGWKAEFSWNGNPLLWILFWCLKSLRIKDNVCWYSEEGGVCVQRRSGVVAKHGAFCFVFFSEREDCRAEEELCCGQRRQGQGFQKESWERGPVALPALRKGPPWNAIPTCGTRPYKAPTGPRRRPIGITRQTEKSEGPPWVFSAYDSGAFTLWTTERNWGEKWEWEKGHLFFFSFELHLFFFAMFKFFTWI